MIRIKSLPLEGILINEKETIRLGDSKETVIKFVGSEPKDKYATSIYGYGNEIRFDFNKEGKIEFIEISGLNSRLIDTEIFGINPFELKATEQINLLADKNKGQVDEDEAPFSYCFLNLSIGIWRDACETYILEEIEEAKENDEFEDWMEEDLEKASHFWTIAIGEKGYYNL